MQQHLFEDIVTQLSIGACVVDADCRIIFWNHFFADRVQKPSEEIQGYSLLEVFPEQANFLQRKIKSVFVLKNASYSYWEQRPDVFQFKSSRPITGEECQMFQNVEIYPIFDQDQQVNYACIMVHDMTVTASYHQQLTKLTEKLAEEKAEQQVLIEKLAQAHSQLLQSEKMAAIGQLAAGVAHEINNPVGFIYSNLQTLTDYLQKLVKMSEMLVKMVDKSQIKQLVALKDEMSQRLNLPFILEDTPSLVEESMDGARRVMEIVRSLKEFSHVDSQDWQYADIVQGIESTLRIINNEVKYKAEVVRNYQADIPQLYCQAMQLNQVFMNIIINAAQAIEGFGRIDINISYDDVSMSISIKDNGHGIAPEILHRICEPFFTTKAVGQGTGLGLSLSYSIIQSHGGTLDIRSVVGEGSEFTIRLPFTQPKETDQSS